MKRRDLNASILSDFIHAETRIEWGRLQRVLTADPESSISSGDVLGPLRASGREDTNLVLRANEIYFSRFRAGDQVDVGRIDPLTKKFQVISGTSITAVRFPAPGVLEVIVPGRLIPEDGGNLFLLPTSATSIQKIIQQKLLDLDRLGGVAEHFAIDHTLVRKNFARSSQGLNSTQIEALKFLMDSDFKGLVQGPPGTGKTHLLVSLVKLAIDSGVRIGLASLSHSAIDNALARIMAGGVEEDLVARVSTSKERIKAEPYAKCGLSIPWVKSFKDINEEARLYAASMHSWCMAARAPEIDLLIIDEASQVPIYFYPFLEKLCSRVIMFGDHKQLPPVIQAIRHNLPADDIFSYQISQDTYPMLETQYRMNAGIQEWSSNRFYNGRLKPDDSNRDRDVLSGVSSASGLLGTSPVNLIRHGGSSQNNANLKEAEMVADLVQALSDDGYLPFTEIGIVTPHRAQAGAICGALQAKIGIGDAQRILVDTVERFQGQEREAMIFSIGVEQEQHKPGEKEFLSDGRRLNVAVTRARSRFYCFAPERLMTNSLFLPKDNHLKSLLGWCDSSNSKHVKKTKSTA